MGLTVTDDGFTNGSVNQGAHTASVTFFGSYDISGIWLGLSTFANFDYGLNSFTNSTSGETFTGRNASFDDPVTLDADKEHIYRVSAFNSEFGTVRTGAHSFRTYAVDATASTQTSSSITSSTATIACNYFPNTDASTADVKLEYRKFGDATWIQAGSIDTGKTGYSQLSISRNLTGLLGSTVYEFRLSMTRTTQNAASFTSAIASFTTLASAPTVVTNGASSIGSTVATLNGTVDPNTIASRVRFGWGTSDAGAGTWANYTSYQNFSGDGDQAFSTGISGLTATTTYFFRALVEHPSPGFGNLVQGSSVSFTTPGDPAAEAAQEDHLLNFQFDAVYGVQKAFVFLAASPAATSSDKFLSAAAPWSTAECQITKDGGAAAAATNAPTRIGTTAFYTITLTATELQAENIHVWISDAGNAARDVLLWIRTKIEIGRFLVDTTQIGGNVAALKLVGVGTGAGLDSSGGSTSRSDITGAVDGHIIRRGTAQAGGSSSITLDSGASGTSAFYNGCLINVISGTGANQQRVVANYDGGTKVVTTDSSWVTNPASGAVFVITPGARTWNLAPSAELGTIPGTTANFGDKVQALFQRFFFKRTQTATVQTLLKADNSTTLGTGSVSDDGVTQTSGKLS